MKLDKNRDKSLTLWTGILMTLFYASGNAGTMGPEVSNPPGKIYLGVFGGAGESNRFHISQYGTAYSTEALGGPLAVNAFGRAHRETVGLIGGHIGYQWGDVVPNIFHSTLSLAPAVEIEGYYLGKNSFTAHDINNDTARLNEHDFSVKFPTSTGVFLTNAILNINPAQAWYHPYIGVGIGGAILSVSHATATQVAPPEPGINHFNANPDDHDATFAAQGKVGVNFDIYKNISLFAEYRGLYLASTNYVFGSTVYAGHAETSSWRVEMNSQYFNMGAVGVHVTV